MGAQDHIYEQILGLSRAIRRRPDNGEISSLGYRITHEVMRQEGIRALDIANKLDVRPASLTDLLRKLEEKGYITRERDKDDSRIFHIYSTEKTRADHENWVRERQEQNRKLAECLTAQEAETFCAVSEKLCAWFEKEYGAGDSKKHRQKANKEDKAGGGTESALSETERGAGGL